jgi:hypothetical protein
MGGKLGRMKPAGVKASAYLFRDAGPITRDHARTAVIAAAICYGDAPLKVFAAHDTRDDMLRRAYAPAAVALADVFKVSLGVACEALEISAGSTYNARRHAHSRFIAAADAARDALLWNLKAEADRDAPSAPPAASPGREGAKPGVRPSEGPDKPAGRRRGPPEPDFLPYEPKRVEITRRGLVPGAGQNVRPVKQGRRSRAAVQVPSVRADVIRWVTPAVRRGADVAELADLFNLDADALRVALVAAGVIRDARAAA